MKRHFIAMTVISTMIVSSSYATVVLYKRHPNCNDGIGQYTFGSYCFELGEGPGIRHNCTVVGNITLTSDVDPQLVALDNKIKDIQDTSTSNVTDLKNNLISSINSLPQTILVDEMIAQLKSSLKEELKQEIINELKK